MATDNQIKNTELKKLQRQERAKALLSFLGVIALGVKLFLGIDIPSDVLNIAVDVILGLWSLWAWFRNNYITPRGMKQLSVLKNPNLQ